MSISVSRRRSSPSKGGYSEENIQYSEVSKDGTRSPASEVDASCEFYFLLDNTRSSALDEYALGGFTFSLDGPARDDLAATTLLMSEKVKGYPAA